MTPQQLRASLLQQALSGRLVPQRTDEGTADALYEEIQQEKARLIAEKKIKKEKPLPPITEEDIPYDIPDTWKWVHVQDVICLNPKNDLPDEIEVSFIPMALIDDGYHNRHSFEIRTWGNIKKGFTHFADGDIGIAKITPCFQNRKSVIFRNLKNGYGAGTTELSIVRVINDSLSRDFLLWFFKSAYFIDNGVKSFTGTAGQQRIHKDYLAQCLLPLPPLAEQKRIVAKLEELLPLVDQYEDAAARLADYESRFPDDLRKSLLQEAITGRLVPQRADEGTADALYEEIQQEKARLIAEKKIKKEKPLPPVAEEEKPFDIPDTWKWVRLGSLIVLLSGTDFKPEDYNDTQNGIPYITGASSLSDMGVIVNRWTPVPRIIAHEGDILLVCKGSGYGKTVFCNVAEAHIARQIMAIQKFPLMNMKFIRYFLMANFAKIKSDGQGVIPGIARGNILQMPFPLPPLAEQERIAAKLEELLPFAERIRSAR